MAKPINQITVSRVVEIVDADAIAIGDLYERSDLSFIDAVNTKLECGRRLAEKKASLAHGEWLPWLEVNANVLGFATRSTSAMLMKAAANVKSTLHLDMPAALKLSRKMWNNREAVQATKDADDEERRAGLPEMAGRYRVFQADIAEAEIEPGSIDAIIADPPYAAEFLPLYDILAERAKIWLKPDGVLAVMSGQVHLPEVYRRLGAGPSYRWTFAYLTPGGQAVQIFPRRINTFWKPVLVYVNGDPASCEWAGDVTRSDVNDNDKQHHRWGQSVSGMSDLIGRLTRIGDLILDPFMGAGTTGVAALLSGRRFVGFDVDQQHVDAAASRLSEAADAAV